MFFTKVLQWPDKLILCSFQLGIKKEKKIVFKFKFVRKCRKGDESLPSDPVHLRWRWWVDQILSTIRQWRSRHPSGCCQCIRTESSSNLWQDFAAPETKLFIVRLRINSWKLDHYNSRVEKTIFRSPRIFLSRKIYTCKSFTSGRACPTASVASEIPPTKAFCGQHSPLQVPNGQTVTRITTGNFGNSLEESNNPRCVSYQPDSWKKKNLSCPLVDNY